MKKTLYAFICIIMSASMYAQTTTNSIFSNGDNIRIELNKDSEYFYIHEMKKGHSLYSLSKLFNTSLNSIYQINGLHENAIISIGQKIKIPMRDEYLYKGISLNGLTNGHFIPVYYQTKPKDNLFRISRMYFNQPTEDLVKRNELQNNNLSLGQDILIGWFPIDGSLPVNNSEEEFVEDFEIVSSPRPIEMLEDQTLQHTSDVLSHTEIAIDSVEKYPSGFNLSLLGSLSYKNGMKEVKKSEVAHWDSSMPDNGTVYVLHKDAIIDSYIEMYNPLLKRSVRAKVIGRIPYGAYTKDVCLILSPRAAKHLKAIDKRFKVEIKVLIQTNK